VLGVKIFLRWAATLRRIEKIRGKNIKGRAASVKDKRWPGLKEYILFNELGGPLSS
jgi:hypothetical protein